MNKFSSSPGFASVGLQLESIPESQLPSAARYSGRVLLVNLGGERSKASLPAKHREKKTAKQPMYSGL